MRVDEVTTPQTVQECVAFLKRRPQAIVWAGGTLLMAMDDHQADQRPVSILDLHQVSELRQITGSDRSLEIGAGVSLQTILGLPQNQTLRPLKKVISSIANPAIRNMATLGGNMAAHSRFMSCFPVLMCMDASFEIRDSGGAHWSGLQRIIGPDGRPALPAAALITRIRLPALSCNVHCVKAMGDGNHPHPGACTFAAAVRLEKHIVMDIRICAAGTVLFRDREAELGLIGKYLPLARKDAEDITSLFRERALAAGMTPGTAGRLVRYIRTFLEHAPEETFQD